jgi:hypothetical protein
MILCYVVGTGISPDVWLEQELGRSMAATIGKTPAQPEVNEHIFPTLNITLLFTSMKKRAFEAHFVIKTIFSIKKIKGPCSFLDICLSKLSPNENFNLKLKNKYLMIFSTDAPDIRPDF